MIVPPSGYSIRGIENCSLSLCQLLTRPNSSMFYLMTLQGAIQTFQHFHFITNKIFIQRVVRDKTMKKYFNVLCFLPVIILKIIKFYHWFCMHAINCHVIKMFYLWKWWQCWMALYFTIWCILQENGWAQIKNEILHVAGVTLM